MPDNPLASRRMKSNEPPHPAMQHAQLWQAVNQMSPDTLAQMSDTTSYMAPVIGALAANPKVTAKMVIRAVATASADGKMKPSEAVQFISSLPTDPDELQPFLRKLYAANLSGLVHMKARMMGDAAPQMASGQQAPADRPLPASPAGPQIAPPQGMPQ